MPVFPGFGLTVSDIPLRRINTRGRIRPTGRFASRKMRCCLPWESSNELAWLQRAELDPDVTAFYAQPIIIELQVRGRRRSYCPDGAVIRRGCVEIHEVKPDADAADSDVRDLAIAAARHLKSYGALYGFALESQLKRAPVYVNIQDVLRRRHRRVTEAAAAALVAAAQDEGPLTAGELVRIVRSQPCVFEDILALVACGRLRMNFANPVVPDRLVWAPDVFPHGEPVLPFPHPPSSAT
jgi:hypothetical protein